MAEDTPEQRARQSALDAAVAAFYSGDPEYEGYLLTNWVLVSTHLVPQGVEQEERTSYSRTYMGGTMPYYMILGLLDYALHRTRAETCNEEDLS